MLFESFLLNEETTYFDHRLASIIRNAQEIQQDAQHIGPRHLSRLVTNLVNQIRLILHSPWGEKRREDLRTLQKIGCGLMKAVDGEGDVKAILDSSLIELQKITQKLGAKINNLG